MPATLFPPPATARWARAHATTERATQEAPTKPLPNPLMPDFWAVLALIGTLLANTLLWFVQRWLIGVRAAIKYAPARRMDKGTHLFITPHPHQVSSIQHTSRCSPGVALEPFQLPP
jgi:hypothetical protein